MNNEQGKMKNEGWGDEWFRRQNELLKSQNEQLKANNGQGGFLFPLFNNSGLPTTPYPLLFGLFGQIN